MKPITLIFADDDQDIQTLVNLILGNAGIEVIAATNGSHALQLWQTHPVDMLILDVMMPVLDGFETCRRIRQQSDVPILMLTARDREQDVVTGLEAGADDYIIKPFRPKEFLARIQTILRRTARQKNPLRGRIVFDNLVLDMDSRRVMYQGRSISISPLEFDLLRYMMEHAGKVVSKEDLLRNVWGYNEVSGDMNLIEATIGRLRKKIEVDPSQPQYIQTVWGTGYRFG